MSENTLQNKIIKENCTDISSLKIHHIGYLVKNIDKSCRIFERMGYEAETDAVYDGWRDVDIQFLIKSGYRVELVAPRSKDSVVGALRKKIGNSPYHICYEVDDIARAVQEAAVEHFVIWQEKHEAVALDGRDVVFLINGQIGMIELLETAKAGDAAWIKK